MDEDEDTEEDKIKKTTLFYCKMSDGPKLCGGGKEHCDLNSDIKWGGCLKATKSDAKKPSSSCACKKVEDIPYTVIKYFKEFTSYPDKASWPTDKPCFASKKKGRKESEKFVDEKVANILETLSNEVKGKGYDGEYTHEARRNRVLYAIPYTGKWWGNFRHKATEARRRNLQKTKRARTQKKVRLSKKHERKLEATTVGIESNLGGVLESGVVAGKKDGVSSQNSNKEVHANTYEVNSVSPDGLNKVSRQVADVVSTTVATTELHQSEMQAVGKKISAQKSNSVTTSDSGERLGKGDEEDMGEDSGEDEDEDGDDEDDSSDDDEDEEKERKAAKDDSDEDDDDDEDEDEDDEDSSEDKERKAAKKDDDEEVDEEAAEDDDESGSDNGSDNDSDSDEEIRELVSEDIKNDLKKSSHKKYMRKLGETGFSFDESLKYDLSKIFGKGKFEDATPDRKAVEKLADGETREILKELGQVKSARILGAALTLLLTLIYLN